VKNIKDNFSGHAQSYAKFRPSYPDDLYEFIFSQVKNFQSVWDCGTGNGQVALKLAEKFDKVYATDISGEQLKNAIQKNNISYIQTRAEQTKFSENSIDLITVAQAIHWFDFNAFYEEVRRVAVPNAIIAVWGYCLLKISPEIDELILEFYNGTIGKYWDSERSLVDQGYRTIPFPFKEVKAPSFEITVNWNCDQLFGYLNTWSSVQKYIKENKSNPVDLLENRIRPLWKATELKRIAFPLFTRIGSIEK
jgi:SAM-dependent methyltransferase